MTIPTPKDLEIPFDERIERDWPMIENVLSCAAQLAWNQGEIQWCKRALRSAWNAWQTTREARDRQETIPPYEG